jgi:hypothetical protein
MLGKLGAEGKVLLLTDGAKQNVYLSSRNLPAVEVRPFGEESAYDILWANVLVIEKAALDGAEPSAAQQAAIESRSRGVPAVKAAQQAAEEAQAERRNLRPGRDQKSKRATGVKVKAEVQPGRKVAAKAKPKSQAKAKTEPAAKSETKTEAAPKAKAAPKKKAASKSSSAAASELDLATAKLPKVGDMTKFLTQFDSAADIKTLMARDSRKTVQAYYEARLSEISDSGKGKKE